MNDDPKSARQFFEQSLEQSKKLKFQEGMMQARSAIRRLGNNMTPQRPSVPLDDNSKSGSVPNEKIEMVERSD
jgi:hypothetical protein